ncbi:MAG: efflux RND transporter periplasmic adaptor subunit [Sediminibacterium sp.]|jgi:RND family efflux transporter MFP subunit|nr:efflux RND transporter periplasmic adaptor subunit [Sediminibacterium sp.]
MNKSSLVWGTWLSILLISCSDKTVKNEEQTYLVVNPILKDTTYERDYAATINSFQNVEIRSKVKGFVENIYLDEGQKVKKGQILFTLNSKEYEQHVHKAEAAIQSTLAELRASEIEVENTKKLFDKNIVSKSELDLITTKVNINKAKVNEARVAKEQALLHVEFTKIKAPFDGIINRIPNKKGSLIDEGALLTSISNNESVYAYFSVSEIDYLDYVQSKSKNNTVTLSLANNSIYPYKGTIETTESEFNKETGNIAFRAKFPNPEKLLKEGGTGKILVKKLYKNAIIIPQKSTFEVQGNIYVYLVDKNNTVYSKKINPINRLSNYFVLDKDLTKEDKLIYEGIQSIKTGDKVKYKLIKN